MVVFPLLSFLTLFTILFGIGNAQYNQATSINNNGQAVWTSVANAAEVTISSLAPAAQPTLVWNCQQMPSICQNVANWLTRQNNNANLPGGNSMEFVYDSTRTANTDLRRARMCENVGSPWNGHQCPDTTHVVNSNIYQGLPAGVVAGGYYAGLQITVPAANFWMIPGPLNANQGATFPFQPSGLGYSCDEFPPATWVQGGDGEAGSTPGTVICAGQRITCFSGAQNAAAVDLFGAAGTTTNAQGVTKKIFNAGEQDWQGKANIALSSALNDLFPLGWGAAAFQFSTTTMAAPAGAATTRAYVTMPGSSSIILNRDAKATSAVPSATIASAKPTTTTIIDNDYWVEKHEDGQLFVIGANPTTQYAAIPSMSSTIITGNISAVGNNSAPGSLHMERMVEYKVKKINKVKKTKRQPPQLFARQNTTAADNATQSDIDQALAIVKAAIEEQSKYNKNLFNNPRRNSMNFEAPTVRKRQESDLPNYSVNSTVAKAAALLAELEVAGKIGNSSLANLTARANPRKLKRQSAIWWRENIEDEGTSPFNANSSSYRVWRNVETFGADPTGQTDSTEAINNAISSGYRCGAGCNSSSVSNALIFFPAGTYLVSSPIIALYGSQLVGDPLNPPTILAASYFVGLGVISSDVYIAGGAEYYINQNNFFRQIRNFIIDIRAATVEYPAGLHWQVAQATSLQNINFVQNTGTQQGIYAENGSGGFMSDLTFTGGNFGMYGGNQQFTVRNLTFTGCTTAIGLIWDWGWTWKDLMIENCGTGIDMRAADLSSRQTGSTYILDSTFVNTNVAILTVPPIAGAAQGTTYITLDNVVLENTPLAIKDSSGNTVLAGGSTTFNSWTLGRVYNAENPDGAYTGGEAFSPQRPITPGLRGNANGGYFTRSKPQYESYTANQAQNVQVYSGAKGDGVSDDTADIQATFDAFEGQDVIIFFPAGVYIVTDTITIPNGAKVVGDAWTQIMASGSKFEDISSPHVMVRVGNPGDVGSVEIQDMLFTTKGATAGAVLMEWNILASTSGSAAMWDSHFRVGGAQGNNLQVADCPKYASTPNPKCIAASLLLHITAGSSAYLENVWAWTADHDMDDPLNTQIDVYSARGILIESTDPTWLYGTASEHSVLYQYELYQAENVYMGMIQTESPYYPPNPKAPAPFTDVLGLFSADPNFSNCATSAAHCAVSWALRIVESTNIEITGAGLYSWFQNYDEDCVNTQNCQQSLVSTLGSDDLWLFNIVTIGAVEMISPYGSSYSAATATDNTNAIGYPWWSVINGWLLLAEGASSDLTPNPSQTITLADWFFEQATPSATCWFPCVLEFPPVTLPPMLAPIITSVINGATRTITPPVNQSPIITAAPITITASGVVGNAVTSTNVPVIFSQGAIEYPPFPWTDPDNGQTINITGIVIPLPILYPTEISSWYDPSATSTTATTTAAVVGGGGGGASRSNPGCWFMCTWPLNIGGINFNNGAPFPKIGDIGPPAEIDTSGDGTTPVGGDQPQEEESSSSSASSSSSSSSSEEDLTCTLLNTIAIATDGVSFTATAGGATPVAWASSYPSATNNPVFGTVQIGVTATPLTPFTNPATTATAAPSPTTPASAPSSSVPANSDSGAAPLYGIVEYTHTPSLDDEDNEYEQWKGFTFYRGDTIDYCDGDGLQWTASGGASSMPSSLTGITGVYGDTCNYVATADYDSAAVNDVTGILSCTTLSDATCTKINKLQEGCDGDSDSYFQLVGCSWD